MGNYRPIKTSDFRKFLKAHNCRFRGQESSHELWKCPRCHRTVTFRYVDKTIPALHIKTNLRTMGIKLKYLHDWIQKN